MIYLSQGNLPARWAHTVQTVKMSEALARRLRPRDGSFELVTQVHPRTRLGEVFGTRFDFRSWYGVREPFPVRRLVSLRSPRGPVFTHTFDADFARRAVEHARRRRPNAVFTRCHHAAAGCHAAGLQFIYETHTETAAEFGRRTGPFFDSPHLAGVVTISPVLAGRYAEAGMRREKIHVLPDAVDPVPFDAVERIEARRRLGFEPEFFSAVYCGHLYDRRGIEEILAAAGRSPGIWFVLVGGKPKDVERRRSEAAGLPNVRVVGHVPNCDVPAWLRAADVLLMPHSARYEHAETASPLKLFEYMAAERPIVASDLQMTRTHLTHGRNALLIPPDDPAALSEAILKLRDDGGLGERLATTARRDVASFTWDARAEATLKLLERATASNAAVRA